MKLKVLFVLLFLAICGCTEVKDSIASPLNHIPDNAEVIIKINKLSQLKSELKNNTFIEAMSTSVAYDALLKKVKLLDIIESDSSALLAVIPSASDTTDLLLVLPEKTEFRDNVAFTTAETLKVRDLNIQKRSYQGRSYYSTISRDHLIISSSKEVLFSAVDNSKQANSDAVLLSLYRIANPNKSGSIFIRNSNSRAMEHSLLKDGSGLRLADYSQWISLDIDGRPDHLNLHGVALANDSTKHYLKLFSGISPIPNATAGIAPSTANAILSFSLAEYHRYANNQMQYQGKSFEVDSIFSGVEEIGHIFIRDKKAIVLHTYASENISDFLGNIRNGAVAYQGNEINSLSQTNFLTTFFDPIIGNFTARYYTVLGDAFVFGRDRSVLQLIISAYNRKDTFKTTALYQTVEESLADDSNILFISDSKGLQHVLSDNFSSEFLGDIKKIEPSKFSYAAQVIADDHFFHNNLVVKEIGHVSGHITAPLYSIQIDAEVATDPQFVLNHRTRKKEIVVQDVNNYLYLISTEGKVLWKKQLDGKIQGEITQVDIYKNGRLQLAFTTLNSFIILDRNGKEVPPFTMKFEGGNLNPLAVFDYEGNKNYRFVLTQGTKVYMYNSKGKIVSGFKYTTAESNILKAPKHLRIGRKDYLVFMLEDGRLKILNRAGKTRIAVKDRIEFSDNEVLLYRDKFTLTDKTGTLIAVDQKGGISRSKLNFNEDHGIDATSKTLATMNDNSLSIKGNKVALELGVYTKPKIFYINDKIYVSVTDLQSQQTYLFDSNAVSIPNFPVNGVSIPDMADIDADGKLELLTKENDSSLIVYKLN